MAADDLDDGRNTAVFRWRWIDAARYLVALAVTALIVTVIAHAVHVLLRPDVLVVLVNKGSLAVEPGTPAGNLSFGLDMEFANPSGRVVIYYEHITAYLYGQANNKTAASYFANIPFKEDVSLKQDSTKFEYLHAYPDLTSSDYKPFFDLFNSSAKKGIPEGVVVVNGTLTIGLYWSNQTARTATYYCWPVAIGGDSSEDSAASGAQCSDDPPTPEASLT
uniref:Uncharacterized protein n=1 Tax=Avena sativa TaxID=4498 RepID=A0ACD5WKE9_AVESA